MRTKSIILTAALVAAGALSSQAQNVFSQNVVGYVQQVYTNGIYYMVSNPLDNGTNTVANVLVGAPNNSQVQLFNGVGYDVVSKNFQGNWSSNVFLPPGKGFFVRFGNVNNGSLTTNTFLGNVSAPIGNSTTNTLAAGFQIYGSQIPYLDSVTNTTTVNLGPVLQGSDGFQKWNVANQGYDVYSRTLAGTWNDLVNGVVTHDVPAIGVAEGFWFNNAHALKLWVETLPAQ